MGRLQALSRTAAKQAPSFIPVRNGLVQRKCACGGSASSISECAECRKQRLQRRTENPAPPSSIPHVVHEVLRSPGQSLDAATRAFIETLFGHDFSRVSVLSGQPRSSSKGLTAGPADDHYEKEADAVASQIGTTTNATAKRPADFGTVRVHTDSRAVESAKALGASAYTAGDHIVFGAGKYAPGTIEGRSLLAHELTHVLQQAGHAGFLLQRSPDEEEKESDKGEATPKFAGCSETQQTSIKEGISHAERLASRSVQAFEREFPLSFEMRAMTAHFGDLSSKQQSTIIERYKHIQANLGGKTYTCQKRGKKVKEGKVVVDLCGQAPCPGSKIMLFPDFGKETCPAGPVLLHEAAHNAGACEDIDKGKGYPPASAENNAYSYEYFALDIVAGHKTPELGKRKPRAPEIKD